MFVVMCVLCIVCVVVNSMSWVISVNLISVLVKLFVMIRLSFRLLVVMISSFVNSMMLIVYVVYVVCDVLFYLCCSMCIGGMCVSGMSGGSVKLSSSMSVVFMLISVGYNVGGGSMMLIRLLSVVSNV